MSRDSVSPTKHVHVLPDDVMLEILSRLPVRSLLRFSCVCKSWHALLRDPIFIKLHAHDSKNCYLLTHYDLSRDTTEFLLISHDTKNITPIAKPCPGYLVIIGCCNGLVCLTQYRNYLTCDSFILLNPALSEIKEIPPMHPKSSYKLECCLPPRVGFGFDTKSADYKIFRIEQCLKSFQVLTRVDVYLCGNDSWKRINVDTDFLLSDNRIGLFWNNSVFFLAHKGAVRVIVSFDLANETIATVISIEDILATRPINFECTLDLLKDHLALLCFYDGDDDDDDDGLDDNPGHNPGENPDDNSGDNPGENPGEDIDDDDHVDIWIMKEDKSWNKEGSFHDRRHWRGGQGRNINDGGGDFILFCRLANKFCLYDKATSRVEYLDTPYVNFYSMVASYKESLITLKGMKTLKTTSSFPFGPDL